MAQENGLPPRIIQLAAKISESVTQFQTTLNDQSFPSPSFSEDYPARFPPGVKGLQDIIIDATSELQDLLLEPADQLVRHGAHTNMASFQFISRFSVAELVPEGGSVSFEKIAQHTGISVSMTRRLLRQAMTMRVFYEPEPDMVGHTKASKALRVPHMNNWLACGSHEMWPAAVKIVDAAQKWPDSQETNETGFSLANDTSLPLYETLSDSPLRAARFAGAMQAFSQNPKHSLTFVTDHYPWSSLAPDSHIVDIGGNKGHVSLALARKFPHLRFTVQDMAEMIKDAQEGVEKELNGRVKFMEWDLFRTQSVPADVYYLRWILHNWPDQKVVEILKAQVPMFKANTRLLLNETCMPDPGVLPTWTEKILRMADLNMAAMFNAKERTVAEWKALFAEADGRFELNRVIHPKGSALALIEVIWNESAQ